MLNHRLEGSYLDMIWICCQSVLEFAEEFNSISWKSRFATRHLRHLAMLLNNFRKSRNIISVFCFFALPSISLWRLLIWKENSSQSRIFTSIHVIWLPYMTGEERGSKTPTQFFQTSGAGSNAGAITGNTTTRTPNTRKRPWTSNLEQVFTWFFLCKSQSPKMPKDLDFYEEKNPLVKEKEK